MRSGPVVNTGLRSARLTAVRARFLFGIGTCAFTRLSGRPLSVAIMLYTLQFGVLFLAIQGIVGLFLWRVSWRKKMELIGAWLAAVALYIPWIIVMIQQIGRLAGGISNTSAALSEATLDAVRLMFSDAAIPLIALYALGAWYVLRR